MTEKICQICGKNIRITSHYCFHCLYEIARIKKKRKKLNQDIQKKIKEEFRRIKYIYVDDVAREYLEMLQQSPILLSEMPFRKYKARKIIDKVQILGLFVQIFRFKPKHKPRDIILYYHEPNLLMF